MFVKTGTPNPKDKDSSKIISSFKVTKGKVEESKIKKEEPKK